MSVNILLIGCGNLGSALLRVWIDEKCDATSADDADFSGDIVVVQPSLSSKPLFEGRSQRVMFVASSQDIPSSFFPDVVVIAIKPQKIPDVLPIYAKILDKAFVVSLAAGVSLKSLKAYMGKNKKLVRMMPTIAMQIGESVNLAVLHPDVCDMQPLKVLLKRLFNKTGDVLWLEKEEAIDLLTPLSGCGPAYFFLLAELLVKAAGECGVEETLARKIVQQTLKGSSLLLSQESDFSKLIGSVASKGGVTEQVLALLSPALERVLPQAYQAALHRITELAK